uniref:Reverse transcriptase domain-containing protein n=1 Tax=Tanacetum cinerariifolium TaxID=118510 RepID=A0A6L2J5U4_TANCI|nr:reverse transcriptase domain-containing protein [Tanacetum cinerariifolium]
MVNVISSDYVDDVPVVTPNQNDDVPVVPEPVLEDEDEDSKEEEFEEEEDDPQKEEDDMEVDIEEDENKPELTYPYKKVDPLNPSLPASESEPEDVIKVENLIEHEDETVHASVHETMHALVEKKRKAKDKYYGKLILDLGNEVRSSVEQGTIAMEKLVEKLGSAEEKVECKKMKKELEEARLMPPKTAPLTQAAIRRMIKESVDAAIAAERARQANAGNDARGSGPVRGQDAAPTIHECTFAGFMKCNPTAFHGPALTWWNAKVGTMGLETNLKVKEYNIVAYTQRFNELALMCPRMVEPERVKVDAYIWGLTDNIKGEVTSSKPANLNEVVRMAHKLMEQKLQARDERILKGKKRNKPYFEIDLMPIELGTFDVIIGMDWLVKHDAVIICGKKVVRILYGNKTLIVKSDKGVSRQKVISCIKARKYVERGCDLFLAHVTEKKSREKQLEDVPIIREFPEELAGLPPGEASRVLN